MALLDYYLTVDMQELDWVRKIDVHVTALVGDPVSANSLNSKRHDLAAALTLSMGPRTNICQGCRLHQAAQQGNADCVHCHSRHASIVMSYLCMLLHSRVHGCQLGIGLDDAFS